MPNNPQRVQVGPIAAPSQIQPQSAMPDTYSRPRKNMAAGSLLGELADALSSTRPGVAALSKAIYEDYQDEEFVSGQQFRQQLKEANAVDKSGWSRSKLHGYEMADAQIVASKLPFAYEEALKSNGLWDSENTHPEAVQKVFAEVRAKYAAKGQGQSPVWSKTFEQYRQGFENGVLNRWLQNVSQIREQTAKDNLITHTSQQVAGAVQLQDATEANKIVHGYLDESFRDVSVDSPTFNRSVAAGFYNAYRQALTTKDFVSADRIREMASTFETKQGSKLFETGYGSEILAQMDRERHGAVVEARQVQHELRQQAIDNLQVSQWEFLKPYIGKPASQWPTDLPKALYDAAGPLGQADNLRKSFLEWRSNYDAAKTEGPEAATALADIERDALFASTSESIVDLKKRLLDTGYRYNGPEFTDKLKKVSEMLTAKETEFGPNGRFSNPAYQEGKSQWARQRSALLGTYKSELRDAHEQAKQDRRFFSLPAGVELNPDEQGNVDFFLPNLEPQMDSYLSSYLSSIVQSRGGSWKTLTTKDMSEAIKATSEEFKPQIEQKVQEFRTTLKQQPQATSSQVTSGLATESGTPTESTVNKLYSSRGYFAWDQQRSGHVTTSDGMIPTKYLDYLQTMTNTAKGIQPRVYANGVKWYPNSSMRVQMNGSSPIAPVLNALPSDQNRIQAIPLIQGEVVRVRKDLKEQLSTLETPHIKKAAVEYAATGKVSEGASLTDLQNWAYLRKAFVQSAMMVPMGVDEVLATDPAWLTTPKVPYPSGVIVLDSPESRSDESLWKIQKHFNLNDEQLRLFVSEQQALLESRK